MSVRDLLHCSLVCKSWNYEARCVQRDFKICYAGIGKKTSPSCEALKYLDDDIGQMTVVPFNGLRLTVRGHTQGPACVGMKSINRYYGNLLNDLCVKYLELSVDSSVGMYQSCPAVQFAQKILSKKCESLVEFSILKIPRYLQLILNSDNGNVSFPKLRALNVSDAMDFRYLPRSLLPDLISASPNLEELRVEACPDDLKFLSPDKLKIVKTFLFMPASSADEELYRNFALARPELRDLRIRPPCLSFGEQRKFWDILRVIIDSSRNSLESLSVASIPAIMLVKLAVGPFQNVTSLVLQVDASESARPIRSLLKGINFTRLFPRLTSVSIYEDSVYENEAVEYRGDEQCEVDVKATATVSRIYISSDCFRQHYVQFIAELFPKVMELRAVMMSESGFAPIYAMWNGWPDLESIKIEEVECYNDENLDHIFCGILPDEAEYLQEQDDEFLRDVHIVPVCPSITCFKSTSSCFLKFCDDGASYYYLLLLFAL